MNLKWAESLKGTIQFMNYREKELLGKETEELNKILITKISAKDLKSLFIIMGIYLLFDVFYPLFEIDFNLNGDAFLWNKSGIIISFILLTSMVFIYLYYMLKKNASGGE